MATRSGRARLVHAEPPDFGMPDREPEIPPETYADRLRRLLEHAEACGYDRLLVHADREHSASMAWLTGFDPRFEEAILVVGPAGDPLALAGTENHETVGAAPLPMRWDRSRTRPRSRSRPRSSTSCDG